MDEYIDYADRREYPGLMSRLTGAFRKRAKEHGLDFTQKEIETSLTRRMNSIMAMAEKTGDPITRSEALRRIDRAEASLPYNRGAVPSTSPAQDKQYIPPRKLHYV